jgi:uncharacterized membrane protein YqgA involved in biofilm formation
MEFLAKIPAGGTLFNAAAIVAGGCVGLLAGRFIPEKTFKMVFQCLGLFSFYIGASMAHRTQDVLTVMFALLLGGVTGVCLDVDGKLTRLGDGLKRCFERGKKPQDGRKNFTQAFVTSSLLFCVGSMSVLGAMEDGLGGNPSLLIVKGGMDGAASIFFAASMGVGVLFSALPLLLYQGALTFAAHWVNALVTPSMLDNLSGLGGLIIIAVGLNFMEISDVKTSNLLPGILFALLFSAFA